VQAFFAVVTGPTEAETVPECGECIEAGVPGDSRGVEDVNDADPGVEGGVKPLRHRVRWPNLRERDELAATNVPNASDTKSITGPHLQAFANYNLCVALGVPSQSIGTRLTAATRRIGLSVVWLLG
jgi:hypothetical protein